MDKNYIFYCDKLPYGTIYGKADLSSPKLIEDEDGNFNVFPTQAVILQDDSIYYEEGTNGDETLDDLTLADIEDESITSAYRITEEEFTKVMNIAVDWILQRDKLMAQYETIKNEYK